MTKFQQDEEVPSIVQSLGPAISICTLIVSIGPYITLYYFHITVMTFAFFLIFIQLFSSFGKKDDAVERIISEAMAVRRSIHEQTLKRKSIFDAGVDKDRKQLAKVARETRIVHLTKSKFKEKL